MLALHFENQETLKRRRLELNLLLELVQKQIQREAKAQKIKESRLRAIRFLPENALEGLEETKTALFEELEQIQRLLKY